MNEEKKEPVATEVEPAAASEAPSVVEASPVAAEAPVQPAPVTVMAADAAEQLLTKQVEIPSPGVVDVAAPRRSTGPSRHLRWAAVVATAIGLGWMGGWVTSVASGADAGAGSATASMRQWLGGLRAEHGETRQLVGDVQTLKAALDEVKAGLDRDRAENAQNLARIGERLDAAQKVDRENAAQLATLVQRAEQTSGTKLASLAERFDTIERADRDPTSRLTQIAERLDRMERQLTPPATPTPAAKPSAVASNEPAHTNAVAESKPATVENWALRDVYNGVALIEGKNRRLIEIVPGQNLPGVGRVEAIERRGKTWIVVTSRGIITSQAW